MKKQRKIKYIFQDQGFTSLTEFKKYVSDFLKPLRHKYIFPKDAEFTILVGLFARHPEAETKRLGDIDIIYPMRSLANDSTHIVLFYKDGSKDDISWNMCVTGKDKSEQFWETQRYRKVVQDQTDDFRKQNKNICTECGSTKNIHVDHLIPFSILLIEFKKKSLPFSEFPNFHRQNATLQLLCKNCNQLKYLTTDKQLLKEKQHAMEQLPSTVCKDTSHQEPPTSF